MFCNGLLGEDNFNINNIIIENEISNNQIENHKPNFIWSFNKPVDIYDLELHLFLINENQDSLIWSLEKQDYNKKNYQLAISHLLIDGNSYKIKIIATNKDDLETISLLKFTMNSLPEAIIIKNFQEQVFTNDTLMINISKSSDNEMKFENLQYHLEITDFQNSTKTLIDTMVSVIDENKLLINGKNLPENGKYLLFIKTFDGVEYSAWSNQFIFFINRRNEPPRDFSLFNKNSKVIFKESPKLKWLETDDPEHLFGGKIIGYQILISPYDDFALISEKTNLSADKTTFLPQKVENHRKYFWKVIAFDSDSMITESREIGIFYINLNNTNPPKAIIMTPQNNIVMKPENYIEWKQPRDKDRWDILSYKIYLYEKENLLSFYHLDETKMDSIKNESKSDIIISYDNSVQMKLKYLLNSPEIIEGKSYNIKIETFDNWNGKNKIELERSSFIYDDNLNSRPNPPKNNFAPDSLIIKTTKPMLTWDKAVDPDINDELKYEVKLSLNPTFLTTRYIQEISDYNENYIKLKTELMENKQYFWKVRSIDLIEAKSEWSELNTFWVNSINESPKGPIELLYPENYTEFNTETSFWWLEAIDVDPGDRIKYLLEIAGEKSFKNKIYSYLIPAIGQKVNWPKSMGEKPNNAIGIFLNEHSEVFKLIDNRMYYWRVTAFDNQNLYSLSPQTYPRVVYNIKNDSPDIPGGFFPGNGKLVNTNKPILKWLHSVDPDFGDLTTTLFYKILLSEKNDFSESNYKNYQTKLGDNFFTIPDQLTENSKYYFKINAFDSHGGSSGWSEADSFFVNAINEPPTAVTEMIPRDNIQMETDSPLLKWNISSDPDPDYLQKNISYQIKYIPNKWIGHSKEKKNTKYIKPRKGETSFKLQNLQENQRYTYWIEATDPQGKKSGWSKAASFSINQKNESPKGFNLLYPFNNADSVITNLQFIWKASYDPDPDNSVVYNLYFSEDSLFINNTECITLNSTNRDSMIYDSYIELKRSAKYFWKVSAEDNLGMTVWGSGTNNYPFVFTTVGYKKTYQYNSNKYILHDNSPNPFYSKTRIDYEIREYGNVKIEVYNVLGEKVKTLVSRTHTSGHYFVEWDGTNESGSHVPGGMYLSRMIAKGFVKNKKMLLLR